MSTFRMVAEMKRQAEQLRVRARDKSSQQSNSKNNNDTDSHSNQALHAMMDTSVSNFDASIRFESISEKASRAPRPNLTRIWPDVMFLKLSKWHVKSPPFDDDVEQFYSDLGGALAGLKQVSSILVHDSPVSEDGLAAFVCLGLIPTQSTITELTLSFCRLRDTHINVLCEWFRTSPKLHELNLAHNAIGPFGVQTLAAFINKLPLFRKLVLHGNPLGDAGCFTCAKMLESSFISEMDMSFCDIGEEGLIRLSMAFPKAVSLKKLWLDGNVLTSAVALSVLDGVRMSKIIHLSMQFTKSNATRAFHQKLKDLLHRNEVLSGIMSSIAGGGVGGVVGGEFDGILMPSGGGDTSPNSPLQQTLTRTYQPYKFRMFTTNEPSRMKGLVSADSRAHSVTSLSSSTASSAT